MSRMEKLVLRVALVIIIFLCIGLFFSIKNRKSGEKIDVLKNVDISSSSYLISPIISELHRVITEREPGFRSHDIGGRMSLSSSFEKLQQAGKATTEEVEAIKEIEKAFDDLSKAVQRLGSITSLRSEMRL